MNDPHIPILITPAEERRQNRAQLRFWMIWCYALAASNAALIAGITLHAMFHH